MKTIFTFLLAIVALYTTAQSKQKFDVIVGVHSGVFVSTYQQPTPYTGYEPSMPYSNRKPENFYNEHGFAIPINAELLFNVYGFRFGGKFEYTGGLYFNAGGQHSFTGLGTVEYGIKLNKNWTMAPAFSAGATLFNNMPELTYWRDYSATNGYVFKGGLNFEMGMKKATFTVSPMYTFYHLKSKWFRDTYVNRCHMYGLNMGVRFHLLRPKA
ncbi:MAG: hypothetical protein JST49_03590 [Bacteroidetes bacterium]|nr:hypothetical protein [Bacteroidota bacterium]